ncbi:MAG: tRNA (N(6)-L-threonylcarbamoyladenosine(37)-C(2))-methylthiotransferase [Desulfurococcaceae archaeon]|jgi:MiaB-like tRNA modifying enzyme|nr:tRNA (N(6)-L-threonylcarbamoyladenosine(37)-C(2))-methylthiotransferase [Desulfurococcaceae archaeon]
MRIYIETYGCALNKSDEALMINTLTQRGHVLVDSIEEADVIIINTCIVRQETEYHMISRIKFLYEYCVRTGKKLIVAGCMARVEPYTVSLIAPTASLVSPQNADKIHFAVERFERVLLINGIRSRDVIGVCRGSNIVPIPIQEGCLNSCSFCIVKYARRQLVSHSIEAIVKAVQEAVNSGAVEVELTGMDLGVYGLDLYKRRVLPELIREIVNSVSGNYMIRIGMINPEHLSYFLDELIAILKESKNVYKFLHIPLQSGSNRVLKLMGRRYTVEEYRSIVREVKAKIPDVSIATDIIIGFPGESDEDFEETIRVMRELEFERVHIAGYSIRPLTSASSLRQVNTRVKKKRLELALKTAMNIGLKVREKYLNTTVNCFITERNKSWVGRLSNYIPVVIKKSDSIMFKYGDWVNVYVDEITFFDIRGYALKS